MHILNNSIFLYIKLRYFKSLKFKNLFILLLFLIFFTKFITLFLNSIHNRFFQIDFKIKTPMMLLWVEKRHMGRYGIEEINYSLLQKCPYKCHYTKNRNKISEADGVLLENAAIDIGKVGGIPVRFNSDQKFFIYLREAPTNGDRHFYSRLPPNLINYTIGFTKGADIYAGYFDFTLKNETYNGLKNMNTENEWNKVKEIVMNKTEGGFAVISHCLTYSRRENFLDELKNRWPNGVKLFGECYEGKKCAHQKCMAPNLLNYHFYFAFENSVCDRYVTEKFFNIKNLIVPVVFRRSDYNHLRIPQNAFISLEDFDSFDSLIKYLKFLMENKDAYLKYFEWTKYFKRTSERPFFRAICEACKFLYKSEPKSYKNVSEWYSPERFCDNTHTLALFKKLTGYEMPERKSGVLY